MWEGGVSRAVLLETKGVVDSSSCIRWCGVYVRVVGAFVVGR